jgi:cytochrome c553
MMIKRALFLSLALLAANSANIALAETAAPPAAQLDMAKAKQTAEQTCAACHMADGNSIIPTNPKLAGQHAAYLSKQLHNFQPANGKSAERPSAVMMGMAANLSDGDIKALAAYFSQQTLKPSAAADKTTLALGQRIWRAGDASKGLPACAGCHGPAGAGLPTQFPRLGGQFSVYTEAQLRAFRAGERSNDPNSVMRTVALRMTDPEIKAVTDYMAGLR